MSKVKLTREQERALEVYKGYGEDLETFIECKDTWSNVYEPLKKLTLDEMARLLYQEGSYEIEQVYEVGDWVIYFNGEPHGNKTNKIELIEDGYAYFDESRRRSMPIESLRHATPEEIAEEKERRWWKRHNRDSWELRIGDVLKKKSEVGVRSVVAVADDFIHFSGDDFPISKEYTKDRFEVVCFVRDRKDE